MYREELRQVRVKGESMVGVHPGPNIQVQFSMSLGECIVTIRQNKLLQLLEKIIATNCERIFLLTCFLNGFNSSPFSEVTVVVIKTNA